MLEAPTNADRAERARSILEFYVTLTGDDWSDTLPDLLSDLRHLCDVDEELDFDRAVRVSYDHHVDEVKEERA